MCRGLYLCPICVICPIDCCVTKPWSSSITLYNNTSIACKHHTNDIPSFNPKSTFRYLTGSVNFELRRFVSRPWTVLRAIGTVFLFCGIICTFAGALELQLYLRCIFPFFMISRRNNLKLMLQVSLEI